MRARRLFLLAGIAGGALIGALTAHGSTAWAAPSDVGSWGQAWGDDSADLPPAQPPRPRTQLPAAPLPTPNAAPAAPMPKGPGASEIGGWGDAWGGDSAPVTAAPRPRTPVPPIAPIATPPAPAPAPVMPRGPSAAEIQGWGDAWGDDGAGSTPAAAAPQPPRQQSPGPQPVAAVTPTRPAAATPATSDQVAPVSTRPAAKAPHGAIGLITGQSAQVDEEREEKPVAMTADQITYDRELGIVTARGRVEIAQSGRMLVADQVSYNLKQDIVAASGNVILAEPSGETMTTNYFELTGDFKEGVAQQIRAVLVDNSRMNAASARRVEGNRTDFEDADYTACEPCRKNPNRTPLWQAKAKRITHNQVEQTIEYRDAWMELGGVPFIYTPYLSHPDPTVKRQSGFLTPTGGQSSNIGTNITVPYFWAIKDNQDITFAPRFLFPSSTAKRATELQETDNILRHVVLAGEHRWRGTEGESLTRASLTADKYDGDLRGHINSKARFDLDHNWRAGYQLERASDDTYTRIYSYRMDNDRPWLTTRPYVEGFGRRSYFMAEAFSYQGLREQDAASKSPLVLPHITSSSMSVPDAKGGYYTVDTDTLAYGRSEGTNSARMSTTVGWQRPYYGSLGDITTVSTSLRGDAYHSDEMSDVGSANAGRAIPTVAANWRMPFVRPSQTMPQVIEPVAMIAASPNGNNPNKIPNEDSIGFELDEINVFRPNRLPGLDRVEGGVRGAYGLQWRAFPSPTSRITAAAAQGWRTREDSTFRPGAGFDNKLSDYVGRLDITPSSNLSFLNRVRLDQKTLEMRRNENTVSIGSPILRTDLSYLMFERNDDDGDGNVFDRRHYAAWYISSALTRYWSFRAGVTYDLTDNGGPLSWQSKVVYDDECFTFATDMRRDYTYDRDYLSGYSLTFNFVFKTMGSVPFNAF